MRALRSHRLLGRSLVDDRPLCSLRRAAAAPPSERYADSAPHALRGRAGQAADDISAPLAAASRMMQPSPRARQLSRRAVKRARIHAGVDVALLAAVLAAFARDVGRAMGSPPSRRSAPLRGHGPAERAPFRVGERVSLQGGALAG
jgi:hypothetical protein